MKLYTVGTSNLAPVLFAQKLKDNRIDMLIDVRRKNCPSWCHAYWWKHIHKMLKELGWDGFLIQMPEFGKSGAISMSRYAKWIYSGEGTDAIKGLVDEITESRARKPALMCAEGLVAKDGAIKCHRWWVAKAAVELMNANGGDWGVCHL